MSNNNLETYPSEMVDLPSKGFFYPKDNPLSKGTLRLRLPTAKHEDILTSKNLITRGIVIDEFLKSLIIDDINYDDLLLGDKSGLIIASRILLYGSEYETNTKCPSCNSTNDVTINLSDLKVKDINIDNKIQGINEHDFILPYSKISIKYKYLTVRDEKGITSYIKKMKKHIGGVEPETTTTLGFVITEVNGETDKSKIQRFISESMSTKDIREFKNHLNETIPGVDTDVFFECSSCGYETTLLMPMNVDFFWPSGKLQK